MEKIFIVTPHDLNVGQLIAVEYHDRNTVVQISRAASREEYKANNPEATDEQIANEEVEGNLNFYETAIFTGQAVLALRQKRKAGDTVHNEEKGSWKLLHPATPEDYTAGLINFGEIVPGMPGVVDAINVLLQVGRDEVDLWWATPYTVHTIAITLTKGEVVLLLKLLRNWNQLPQEEQHAIHGPQDEPTFAIIKLKRAGAKLLQLEQESQNQDRAAEVVQANPVYVERVH